jgi:hypothetical protein
MIVNPKMPDTEQQVQSADAAARAKGLSTSSLPSLNVCEDR